MKSRSECSTAVIAVWPSVNGQVLTTRQPTMENLRVGKIQFFYTHTHTHTHTHTLTIKDDNDNDLSNTFELPHVTAKVLWYQDHPQKLSKFKHGTLRPTTLFDLNCYSNFIPVSRIISRCTILDCQLEFDFWNRSCQSC